MTDIAAPPYYDPYDFAIDEDPYPVWRRLRDEAPVYYNEKYDFYALSHFDDVEAGSTYLISVRHKTFQFISRVVNVADNVTDFNFEPANQGLSR